MRKSINIRTLMRYAAITGIFIAILLLRECQHQNTVDNLIVSVADYKDTAYYYKGENGKIIAYNDALELQNEDQIKAILKKDEDFTMLLEGFKNLDAVGGVKTIIRIENDTIPFAVKGDSIPCDFNPIKVEKLSPNYVFNGTITNTNFVIDSLTIPNEMKFVVGEKKTGLFKRESRIEVVNSNPIVNTTGITSYVVEEKPKWGQKILIFLSGALIGVITYGIVSK